MRTVIIILGIIFMLGPLACRKPLDPVTPDALPRGTDTPTPIPNIPTATPSHTPTITVSPTPTRTPSWTPTPTATPITP